MRSSKTELAELGEEEDEFTQTTSKLRDLVQSLTGFDIMKSETEFKDLYDIVLGIGEEWDNLTDIEQASLGEALAGKRNANALYAVLGNLDTLKGAYLAAEQSAGSAAKEQENYAKSIQYSIDQVKASLEKLENDALSSNFLKGVISSANELIKIADKLVAHPLITLLTSGTLFAIFKASDIKNTIDALRSFTDFIGTMGKISAASNVLDSLLPISQATDTAEALQKVVAAVSDLSSAEAASLLVKKGIITTDGARIIAEKGLTTATLEEAIATQGASTSTKEFAATQTVTTGTTFSLSAALKELAATLGITTGMLGAFILAAAGITAAAVAVYAYRKAQEEAAQAAAESAKEIQGVQGSIDEQIEKYKELKEQLDNNKLTEDEQYSIKKQLFELQQSLNKEYGSEAGQLDLVNGKYQTQLDLLKGISQEKADDYVKAHLGDYEAANKRLNQKKAHSFTLTGGTYGPEIVEYLRSYEGLIDQSGVDGGVVAFNIQATDQEARETFSKLYDDIEAWGEKTGISVDNTLLDIASNIANLENNKTLQADKEFVAEYEKQAVLADDELHDIYVNSIEAVEKYNEALAMEDGVEAAKSNLDSVKKEFEAVENKTNGAKTVFDSVFDSVNTQAEKAYNIQKQLSDESSDAYKLAQQLRGVNDFELSDIDLSKNLGEDVEETDKIFVQLAKTLGVTDEDSNVLINTLDELGITFDGTSQKAQEFNNSLPQFDLLSEDTKKVNTQVEALKSAYQAIFDGDTFDLKKVDFDILSGLRENLQDFDEFKDFERTILNTSSTASQVKDSFSDMALAVYHSSTAINGLTVEERTEAQAALESWGAQIRLAKSYVETATEAERARHAAEANQIVAETLGKSYTNASIGAKKFSEAEIENIMASQQWKLASFETRYELLLLVAQCSIFNNTALDVRQKIQALAALTSAANLATTAIAKSTHGYKVTAKDVKNGASYGGSDVLDNTQDYTLEDFAESLQQDMADVTVDFENLGKAASGAGGAAKDAAKDTKDVLAELSKQLDEIQAAYESLTEIQEHYNENGSITVDQAQELINSDFRYLALLKEENGALAIDEQGFQRLAQAKLEEMQIQLARNAIDAVNSLTDEATAAEYLTMKYHDLAGASLDATEALLQQAVAQKMLEGGAGSKRAEAAKTIMEGYQNAKQMIGKTDFSKKGLSSKSDDKDKDKEDDKDKEKEEEEKQFEKEYDWIDTLLKKVSDVTDKWSKEVDRFFSYWNKNWAINQEIKANRNEILQNEKAYLEYSKEADSVGLSKKYKKKVQDGTIDLQTITNESLSKKIDEYSDLYQKAQDCKDAVKEFYDTERDLIKQKLENVIDYFDTIQKYYSSITSKLDSIQSAKTASGQRLTIDDILQNYQAVNDELEVARQKTWEYQTGISKESVRSSAEVQMDIDTMRSTSESSDYYQGLLKSQAAYEEKQAAYDAKQKEITDLKIQIANETDKATKKDLKKQLSTLKKEAKSLKLTSSEKKALSNIQKEIATMDSLGSMIVDNTTASSAQYQTLIQNIQKLQAKKKLSSSQQTTLQMYLDELDAINAGVSADSLADYIKIYEQWWKLNNKTTALSGSQRIKFQQLTEQKEAIENNYANSLTQLQSELEDALIVESGDETALLTKNLETATKELTDSYNEQLSDVEDSYKTTATYQNLYKKYQNLLAKQEKANNKGKTLGKSDAAILAKYEEELNALATGATYSNIAEYIKAWEYVYKNQAKYDAGKLSKSAAKTYDSYAAQLRDWDTAKTTEVNTLKTQLSDALKELNTEYSTNLNDLESDAADKLQTAWETVKQIIEYQATSLEQDIEAITALVDQYKSVAEVLEQTGLESLKKYNLTDIFGIDDDNTLSEVLSDQLTSAVQASEQKIHALVNEYEAYNDLIKAAEEGDFSKVLSKYADSDMSGIVEDAIAQLNANDYSENTWVDEWNSKLAELMGNITTSITDIQELKDELREEVMFKAIKNNISMLESFNSSLSSMAGLVNDDWVQDVNGVTEYGYAKVNVLAEQLENARSQVANYAELIKQIDEAQANEDTAYGTEDEYLTARNEALENYYSSLTNVESIATEIYEIGRAQTENEISQINKLVEARKQALDSKKAYYDYDKQIKSATKDVESISAQIAALNDVNDAASKAKRAQLEAQLADAQDNLEDLQMQHQFELETSALDKFIEDLESTLDNTAQTIDQTFENFATTITNLLDTAPSTDTASAYQKILDLLMGEGRVNASGFNGVSSNTSSAGSVPATSTSNTSYVPVSATESAFYDKLMNTFAEYQATNISYLNLMKSSMINIENDTSDIAKAIANNGAGQNINITNSYGSLLSVDGAVDATVLRDIQKVIEQSYEYTSQQIFNQLKKLGVVRSY